MVATCIYRGLAKGRIDRIYLFCLPFGYIGVLLLLHFGADLSLGLACTITLLIGDAPGALLAAIIIGSLSLVRKSEEHPGGSLQNPADVHSAAAPEDQ